jgi:hypothetical protein
MSDRFLGSWLVSEYVYNNDGAFVGIVRQRRELLQLENGRIRVIQHCTPQDSLKDHPMGKFVGEWVFELSVEGRARRYHGVDVIGTGLTWGEGAMTGKGLWPRFGHNFVSYAVTPNVNRQITGGKFFNATQLAANIAGLAVNESESSSYPEFVGAQWAGDVSSTWRGTLRTVNASGEVLAETELTRQYQGAGWAESGAGVTATLEKESDHFKVSGTVNGIAKQFGWMLEIVGVSEPQTTIEMMEVLDNASGNLIGLRRWQTDEALTHMQVIKLKPA